jgi:hypothetical protein
MGLGKLPPILIDILRIRFLAKKSYFCTFAKNKKKENPVNILFFYEIYCIFANPKIWVIQEIKTSISIKKTISSEHLKL